MYPIFAILGIGHIVGWAFGNLSSSLLTPLADAIGSGVTTLAKDIGQAAVNSTVITTGARYTQLFDTGLGLAGYIGAFALLVAAAIAAVTQNYQRALAAVVRVFFAIIGSFVLFMMLPEIQSAISVMSKAVAATFGNSSTQVGASLEAMLSVSGMTGTPLLLILFGVFVLIACFILWIILVLAQSIVYFTVFAMPLAFAASYKWGKKIAELTLAMLLVPFVITSILAVGLAVFGDGANFGTTLEHVVAGTGLIAVGCLTPFLLIKLIHTGEAGIQQMKNPHETAHGTITRMSSLKSSVSSFASGGKGAGSPTAGSTGASSGVAGGVAAGAATAGVGAAMVAGVAAAKQAGSSASQTVKAAGGQSSEERASAPGGTTAANSHTPARSTKMDGAADVGAKEGSPSTASRSVPITGEAQASPQGENNPSGTTIGGNSESSAPTTTGGSSTNGAPAPSSSLPSNIPEDNNIHGVDQVISPTNTPASFTSPSGSSSPPSALPDGQSPYIDQATKAPAQVSGQAGSVAISPSQSVGEPLGQITPTKIESTDGGATWHMQGNPAQVVDPPVTSQSAPATPTKQTPTERRS